jgi:flagella basal body P-ring formation protein FlgA
MLIQLALLFGNVTVTLPPQAEVRGTEVRLGAIATVQGDDPAEIERVKSLPLGYAPAPGYTRLFDSWRLHQELVDYAPEAVVTMTGARACRVSPATEPVAASAIEAAAKVELDRHLDTFDATATLLDQVTKVRVPSGARAPVLRSMMSSAAVHPGVVSVPVRVLVDGDVYRTIWTRWKVEVWDRYAVLNRVVKTGERITSDMIELRRMEASASGVRANTRVLGDALLVGALAARELQPGRPLTDLDVVRPKLIKKGDTVFLEVKKGAINARVAAVAEQDGARGDRVRVTLLASAREMQAVVISRDLLQIDLTSAQ